MLEYTFNIKHEGCWTETVNDDFPNVQGTIIYSYRITGTSITMVEMHQVNAGIRESLIKWLENHPVMNTAQLVSFDDNRKKAFISLRGDYNTDTEPVLNVLLRNNCFPTIPATVARGREQWCVLASSHEQVSTAHAELEQLGSVNVDSLRTPDLEGLLTGLTEVKEAIQGLSPRQSEVLLRAIEQGYYDSPRSCTIEELAELDSANTSTVAEHLRRSESKILKRVSSMLRQPERETEPATTKR